MNKFFSTILQSRAQTRQFLEYQNATMNGVAKAMKPYLRHILLACLLGTPLLAQSNSSEWKEIPLQMLVHTDQKITDIPSDWKVVDDETGPCKINVRNFIKDVSVYEGNPIGCARLIPDEQHANKAKTIWVSIWKLDSASKNGNWIRCDYANTRLSVAFQLPLTAKEVRITSSRKIPNALETFKVEYR